MPFGIIHPILRSIAQWATNSFYARIEVFGEDQVPEKGPVLVLSNHHNSAVDETTKLLETVSRSFNMDVFCRTCSPSLESSLTTNRIEDFRAIFRRGARIPSSNPKHNAARLTADHNIVFFLQPAVLSIRFPHGRMLHYWAKSTLFTNKIAGAILRSAGNLSVDRRNKDNELLFASTFDVLKQGEVVALFPEGTSTTLPGLLPQLKDGASWAALEYYKNCRDKGRLLSDGTEAFDDPEELTICIAGISYTDKAKYRSGVVMQFGPSFTVEPFLDEFEVNPKAAAKRMTKHIADELTKLTVNAPDWDTLHAATMARRMLWVDDMKIPLKHLVEIGQTLVDVFATRTPSPELRQLMTLLLAYRSSLEETHLTHYSLSGVPLPDTLDPNVHYPLPTRMRVLGDLMLSTGKAMLRLPFFALPLIVHMPIYLMGRYSLRFSDLQEDHAQNKIALCLVIAMATYVALFFLAWGFLFIAPYGFILAGIFVWLFILYHNTLVDNNYGGAKKLVASWRVLVGIWSAHAKHETLHQLHQIQRRFPTSSSLSSSSSNPINQTSSSNGNSDSINIPLLSSSGSRSNSSPSNDEESTNPIRRCLNLRVESSAALGEWLLGDEEGRSIASVLEGWGAKIRRVRKEREQGEGGIGAGPGSVRLE